MVLGVSLQLSSGPVRWTVEAGRFQNLCFGVTGLP